MFRSAFFIVATITMWASSAFGQGELGWRGLVFDHSTVETAVQTIGKPKRKRLENLKALSPGNVVGKIETQTIEYEKTDGWKKVTLTFVNNKLFKAKFWPQNKKLPASTLIETYIADFIFVEGFAKGVALSVFDGQKEPTVPRVYPTLYFMVAAKPDRYIVASINNGSFAALWKDATRKPTIQMFPGFVEDIEIVSRAGEKP
jgi:hypothetical protein